MPPFCSKYFDLEETALVWQLIRLSQLYPHSFSHLELTLKTCRALPAHFKSLLQPFDSHNCFPKHRRRNSYQSTRTLRDNAILMVPHLITFRFATVKNGLFLAIKLAGVAFFNCIMLPIETDNLVIVVFKKYQLVSLFSVS